MSLMKLFKISVWIFCLYIIQGIFSEFLSICNTTADLLLGFAVIYGLCGDRFSVSVWVIVICAVLNGTLTGGVFPVTFFATVVAGVVTARLNIQLRFVPETFNLLGLSAIAEFIKTVCEILITGSASITESLVMAIPYALYTTVVTGVIYWIMKRTLFRNQDKRLVIIQEMN